MSLNDLTAIINGCIYSGHTRQAQEFRQHLLGRIDGPRDQIGTAGIYYKGDARWGGTNSFGRQDCMD